MMKKKPKVNKLICCSLYIPACLGKKLNNDNELLPGNVRWCFHQANYKPTLTNPTGLVQPCGLDTPQEVTNHGNTQDQAKNNKLLTDKNVHIYMGFQCSQYQVLQISDSRPLQFSGKFTHDFSVSLLPFYVLMNYINSVNKNSNGSPLPNTFNIQSVI